MGSASVQFVYLLHHLSYYILSILTCIYLPILAASLKKHNGGIWATGHVSTQSNKSRLANLLLAKELEETDANG